MKDAQQCTYTTRHLCLRDELVLKSIVRILHGQTHHNWQYDASHQSDVLILGTYADPAGAEAAVEFPIHPLTIRVGTLSARQGHLMLPLRVGDVLVELNHASDILTHIKDSLNWHASGASVNCRDATYALLRWPAWNVLKQDNRYLRIATVLATGASTILDLSDKTGVSVEVCDRLIGVLKQHDLIRTHAAVASPVIDTANTINRALIAESPAQKDTSSLWHRIRRRLGLNTAQALT